MSRPNDCGTDPYTEIAMLLWRRRHQLVHASSSDCEDRLSTQILGKVLAGANSNRSLVTRAPSRQSMPRADRSP
jgi:hypothetical protein